MPLITSRTNLQAAEVIAHVLKEFVKRMDPLRKNRATRKSVFQRSQGRCTFKDPTTGHTCGSRHQIEIDHIIPRALGGDDSPENLRVLCRQHNLYMSERILGQATANQWRRKRALRQDALSEFTIV